MFTEISAGNTPSVRWRVHLPRTKKAAPKGGESYTIFKFTCAICLRLFPVGVRSFHLA